ncbi:hypothetical protein TrLO_g8104 [Triparma laevis f. longispina]|uniref:Uncharacterized protein n=1 Tax=Triparma laevis f. longispina TaxID=1714387 RepID=A0A9W7A5W0_9STRA|nr:hypothetical protein TrLO_g8104 [Triparma laevis f. longispina]
MIFWWLTNLVQGSVKSEWRKEMKLSIEKIATLGGISLRRKVQGVFTFIYIIRGIFLFSMMSAGELTREPIFVAGILGVGLSVAAVTSGFYTNSRVQEMGEEGISDSLGTTGVEEVHILVEECSWLFVVIGFFVSCSFSMMWLLYGRWRENTG